VVPADPAEIAPGTVVRLDRRAIAAVAQENEEPEDGTEPDEPITSGES
jgi:hypothetical protein